MTQQSATKPKIHYPTGADLALLKGQRKRAEAARRKCDQADFKNLRKRLKEGLDSSCQMARAMGIEEELMAKQAKPIRARLRKQFKAQKPPKATPLKAHNPTRYAPFDMVWREQFDRGIVAVIPYGPNASSGRVGNSLAIWNGGEVSTTASVGFWYYSGFDTTLHVTTQARVWARTFVFSALFGWAETTINQRLWIEQYGSNFTTWNAVNTIYNHSGILTTDVRVLNYDTFTVSLSIPVRRNTWYGIWSDAVQHGLAGGIADVANNCQMSMGPVRFWTS